MKLPVIVPRTYISPSSFNTWRTCRTKFYYTYLAGLPWKDRKQSLAAAIGSAFDAYIKDYIAQKRGGVLADRRDCKVNVALAGIKLVDGLDMKRDIIPPSKQLAQEYIANGFADRYINANLLDLNRTLYILFGGIPIYGIVDIIMNDEPIDLKTRGFASDRTTSPTPGYHTRISSKGENKFEHKLCGEIMMEDQREDWAVQLLWYKWMINNSCNAHIEEIVKTASGWDMAQHTLKFSLKFIEDVKKELGLMWENISGLNCDIDPAMPEVFKCEKYNQLCDVAAHCHEYQVTLGHPENRSMLV